jgi:C1A family cysteine protease
MAVSVCSDCRRRYGPARDQGERPTCLAFAASDAHAALREPWIALSCEFAFYNAQHRAGRAPFTGALLSAMLIALKLDGQPVETDWPYLDTLPSDLRAYSPPSGLQVFRRDSEARADGLDEIVIILEAGQSSLLVMMISDAFYTPDAEGIVRASTSELPDPARRHAVVAVGHGDIDGTRAILVRNSWGVDWGCGGHAWLPEAFLLPRLIPTARNSDSWGFQKH